MYPAVTNLFFFGCRHLLSLLLFFYQTKQSKCSSVSVVSCLPSGGTGDFWSSACAICMDTMRHDGMESLVDCGREKRIYSKGKLSGLA
ncbi:hypothetical protein BX666DRAFT_498867 [Dichotomocladium elegans]|nr:hypothetical protein BX666DRAFT_498867 [Dichotomocladium elegans]